MGFCVAGESHTRKVGQTWLYQREWHPGTPSNKFQVHQHTGKCVEKQMHENTTAAHVIRHYQLHCNLMEECNQLLYLSSPKYFERDGAER